MRALLTGLAAHTMTDTLNGRTMHITLIDSDYYSLLVPVCFLAFMPFVFAEWMWVVWSILNQKYIYWYKVFSQCI